jgi:cytochrome c553
MSTSMRTLIAVAALASLAGGNAVAADIEAGKKKVQEVCAACHGIDGATPVMPEYPKLSGQFPDYMQKALRDYKSGQRKNPIMAGFAQGLSDKDIENVAAYFSTQPNVLATRY